jgi:hypothetical protein
MPRFDNFTNQLDKLPRPTSAAAYIAANSDAIFCVNGNGAQLTAAMSQDMSAFMTFLALGSPNTNMTVSTTTEKAVRASGAPSKVFKTVVTVCSAQTTGADAAAFDLMRSDNRFAASNSVIDGTTDVGAAHLLSIGSRVSASNVVSVYSVPGSAHLIKNYYARSGSGVIVGGNTVLMMSLVK